MQYQLFIMSLTCILVVIGYFLYAMYPKLGIVSEYMVIYATFILLLGIMLGTLFTLTFCKKYMINAKAYKRELEKESIAGDEASAQIKVLESKIQVLEKALEQALNK